MDNSLVIWDQQTPPEGISQEILLWRSYVNRDNFISVPGYLEQHADRFKNKYLRFIHDLGESRLNGKRIVDHLDVGGGFSIWWMTLLAEKNPLKSPVIYDCLRLMVLEEILKEKALPEVKLFSDNNNLRLALEKLCKNLQIKFLWEPLSQKKNLRWSVRKIFYALPHELQAIISLIKYISVRWPLQKIDTPAWYTGKSAFFFALISFTLNQNYVIKDIIILNYGKPFLS